MLQEYSTDLNQAGKIDHSCEHVLTLASPVTRRDSATDRGLRHGVPPVSAIYGAPRKLS